MSFDPPPSWQLPEGVDPSLWRYTHTPRLALEEDAYFQGHPLFLRDAQLLGERFIDPGPLIDLGCGAGRHAIEFARRGFPVTAVDLSRSMLEVVARKAKVVGVSPLVRCVQANLCRLDCFPEATFDYGLSMFSTLGMIRGRPARRHALAQAYRVLRPGGRLAIHAHNVWLNLRNPQGRRWLLGQFGKRLLGHVPFGERRMTYRGIAGMGVHLFTWGELSTDLRSAGFLIDEVIPIHAIHAETIAAPRLFGRIRAGGWVVFARRPG